MTKIIRKVIISVPYQCNRGNDYFHTDAPPELVKKIAEENACIDVVEFGIKNNLKEVFFDDVPHMEKEDLIQKLEEEGYNVYKEDYLDEINVDLDW